MLVAKSANNVWPVQWPEAGHSPLAWQKSVPLETITITFVTFDQEHCFGSEFLQELCNSLVIIK